MTKRPDPISWRPSPEAREALLKLQARDGKKKSRGEILNEAVIWAASEPLVSAIRQPRNDPAVIPHAPGQPHSAKALLGRRGVDPEKIAEFQRKVRMDVFSKRGKKP